MDERQGHMGVNQVDQRLEKFPDSLTAVKEEASPS